MGKLNRHPSSRFGKVWEFRTARFTVSLILEHDRGYRYDGDDEDGETQDALDSGDLVAFNSCVRVELDGETIAENWLHGSVYGAEEVAEFYSAHRDEDPMNRNCSIMRAVRGANVCICHYFPSMVAEACEEARDHVRSMSTPPRVRAA